MRSLSGASLAGAAVLALLIMPACGKVGDPRPPIVRIPERIGDLKAVQTQDKIVLSWTNPSKYVDGAKATEGLGAIKAAGGFTDFANKKRVKLTRADGTTETVNCIKALEDPHLDLEVFPGDGIALQSHNDVRRENELLTHPAPNFF